MLSQDSGEGTRFPSNGDGTANTGDPGLTRVLRAPRQGSEPESDPVEPARLESQEVLLRVYRALQEKGYDPIGQIAHYLLSGEPTYITGYHNARALMTRLERDEIIAELVRAYIARLTGEEPARRRA